MKFDLTRLNNNIDKKIDVCIDYSFNKEELQGTDLLDCEINVVGAIFKNSLDDITLDLIVTGNMYLPCAITLTKTKYPFELNINGTLDELMEQNERNFTNTLDIFPIIWENILMEIPMRVVSEQAQNIKLSGDGWKLITDEDNTSSPLAELEDLIMDREVR